jgi:hypothetical protein
MHNVSKIKSRETSILRSLFCLGISATHIHHGDEHRLKIRTAFCVDTCYRNGLLTISDAFCSVLTDGHRRRTDIRWTRDTRRACCAGPLSARAAFMNKNHATTRCYIGHGERDQLHIAQEDHLTHASRGVKGRGVNLDACGNSAVIVGSRRLGYDTISW